MKKSTRMSTGAGVIVLGALVAATPRFLFPVCEFSGIFMQLGNGKTAYMLCHYTAVASYILGALIVLIGITLMLSRERESRRMLSVVLAGVAVAVTITPVILPICMNPDDPCNHGAKPLLIVLGIVTFLLAGWMGLASRKTNTVYSSSTPDESDCVKSDPTASRV